MAAPSTPAAIPPSPSATTPPPAPTTPPPVSTTTPPPTPAVVPPVPSPPPTSPPPVSPPPVTPAPPPLTPPPTVPPPTPSVVPPPPDSSPPPPILQPPQPSPSPPTVPPPQPSPSPPTESTPPSAPPPTPVNSPPPPSDTPPVQSPPPKLETPPPSDATSPSNSPPPPPPSPQDMPPVSPPSPSVRVSPPPATNSSGPLPSASPSPQSTFSPPFTPTSPAIPDSSSNTPGGTVTEKSSNSGGVIKTVEIVGIGAAVVVIMLLAALMIYFMKRRMKRSMGGYDGHYVMPSSNRPPESQASQISEPTTPSAPLVKTSSISHEFPYSPPEPGIGNSKSWFTYEELSAITNGFSPQNVLGEGGFGCVYKGRLSDGRDVAVKQLKVGGGQGEREFQAEVEIISRVHHRHLVSLVGYCISENQRLLVYDYVPNNTLHYHLHGQGRPVMDWVTRVKVAAGAARGIAYLHEDCHPRIFHRDIKSSNILLDNTFVAQVSDFGLAKLTVDAQTHVTTRVMGTFGYMAPEYASSGKLTDRSDVFSFGVVLLELVTGRKPVDASQPIGDESLVEWARPLMSRALETGNFDDLPDSRLAGNYNENEMFRMIETAAACVRHSAPMRPRMGLVMRALDDLTDSNLDLHNGVRPGQSELFNAGANSAEIRLFQRMAFGRPDNSSDFSHATWSSERDL